ncbi:primosomal protein N' [Parvularcula sp. BGMRC 0090]|uniref:Replication restart protein PriA n=2 Tax=Parvularcula maris TaxID=2965077 RepID=A0A9X2L6C7_9PROT|nr:primosomal protein N' [Parvularcula maris]
MAQQAQLLAEVAPVMRVKVLLPLPMGAGYDYAVPEDLSLTPGDIVSVPLGPREVTGVVWPGGADGKVPDEKLKPVKRQFSVPRLSPQLMDFVDWVASYYMVPKGAVLRMVLRREQGLADVKGKTGFRRCAVPPHVKLTAKRKAVLEAAGDRALSARELAEAAGVTDGVVRSLAEAGALEPVMFDPDPPFGAPDPDAGRKELSQQQEAGAAELRALVRDGQGTALLDGVTGSGKTEVYFEAVAEALRADPEAQVLVMLPEIALTLPFLKRLEERFGTPPAHWHSDVSSAGRRRVWKRVLDGSARLVVGARSALFLPWQKLKLIVIDEEHDQAYKQQDGILYHARDMAVAMGARQGFPVVLASATPSLETVHNCELGRYSRVRLPSRYGPAVLPDVEVLDLRAVPPEANRWLAEPAVAEITETLIRGKQVLLYLNRRGYAPVTICRRCGERMTAPDSDTWLVEHRYTNRLICHQTGFSMPKPEACPHCQAKDTLAPCGPGVERVAEEAKERWPDKVVEIFSSDTVEAPGSAKALLERMTAGEIDILVATQAAAKGHNFPGLTLVVGVDADLGLSGGDLRAAERTYQVLSQVSGRAGRAKDKGRVLLQSYQPDHSVNLALTSGDRDAFFGAELHCRDEIGMPPFGRLASVILSAEDERKLLEEARALASHVPHAEGIEVWGPAPAPFYRLRGIYRQRFLIRGRKKSNLQAFASDWLAGVKGTSAVRRVVDIDPYNFF